MKVWTNTSFQGHYPVGVSAIVIADDVMEATVMLNEQLKKHGLHPSAKENDFFEVDINVKRAIVLQDGDY